MDYLYDDNFTHKPKTTYKQRWDVDGRTIKKSVDQSHYREYIKSKKWQWRRNIILRRDDFKCVHCGSKSNLNVHHLTYANLGREADRDLITLCRDCHKKEHYLDLNKDAKQNIINEINEKYGFNNKG